MKKFKQAALGTVCIVILSVIITLNPKLKELISLKIVNVVTGMELSELKTFPDAPERVFVSSSAIKLDQAGHGTLYVVRGKWIEIKTTKLQLGDRVVIFK